MEYLFSEEIQSYLDTHTDEENPLYKEIIHATQVKYPGNAMNAGHFQGRLLSFISKMIRPKYILEIGTFMGYSALCLAEGLKPNGQLHTIEQRKDNHDFLESVFSKSAFSGQISLHHGDAIEVLNQIDYPWDLIFLDANKKSYPLYYHVLIKKMKSGSFLLIDNVLWKNKVVSTVSDEPITNTLRDLNTYIKKDNSVEKIILPVRDGIFLIRKK